MDKIKIRDARDYDLELLYKLLTLLQKESRYSVFPINEGKLRAFISSIISKESSMVKLATVASKDKKIGRIVGVFIANISTMYFSDCTQSSDFIFYVSPGARKNGIGDKLMSEYFSWAKANNVNDISLSTSTGISTPVIEKIAEKYDMIKVGSIFKAIN